MREETIRCAGVTLPNGHLSRAMAVAILVVLLTTGACHHADLTITDDFTMLALVYGRVTAVQGQPIASASITLAHFDGPCGMGRDEQFTTTTDTLGQFRRYFSPATNNAGCVRVIARAPGFASDSLDLARVPFGLVVADSAEANLVLRAP